VTHVQLYVCILTHIPAHLEHVISRKQFIFPPRLMEMLKRNHCPVVNLKRKGQKLLKYRVTLRVSAAKLHLLANLLTRIRKLLVNDNIAYDMHL
jgi:hypothetical protein